MASAGPAAADFSCSICFDTATEPVVTRCGHLFCWECLEHWLHSTSGGPECPMCKGRVDEHVAGDIIPLYGKGRQAHKPAGGSSAGTASTAPATAAAPARTTTTTTTTTTHTTTTIDPAQEAFFSCPTAYSYAPAREARRATETAGAAPGHAQPPHPSQSAAPPEHHPRPSADRAPPRPRPPHPQQQYQNVQLHRSGVPLTMGSGIFFFGGGTGMFFSLFVIAIWAVYQYAPLRDWARTARQWFDRRHGITEEPDAASHNEHDARPASPPSAPHAMPSPAAPSTGSPADPNAPPASVQHLMIGLVVMFVLLQLLVYM